MAARLPTLPEHETYDDERLPPEFRRKSSEAMLNVDELELKEEVGRGGFSQVYRAVYKGTEVAVKKMPLVDKDAAKYLDSEIAILKNTSHPSLIKYYGAAIKGKEVYIVTEFMNGGDLSTILSKHVDVPLPWRLRCRIARDALQGIVALHENECIHRDIKSENFLLDDAWRCVVADYGFARKSRNDVAMTICGTDEFMAPEVIFGEVYDERADVFSFGVFLCELICRKVPGRDGFLQREPRSKFQLDFDAMRAMAPADAPASLLELAVQCCCYEAEYRMTSEDALEWLNALTEELEAAAAEDATSLPPSPGDIRKRPQVYNTMTVSAALAAAAAAAGDAGAGAGRPAAEDGEEAH